MDMSKSNEATTLAGITRPSTSTASAIFEFAAARADDSAGSLTMRSVAGLTADPLLSAAEAYMAGKTGVSW